MVTNIFYRIPGARTQIATFNSPNVTQAQFQRYLEHHKNLPSEIYTLSPSKISFNDNATVTISLRLLGGKGGFGSRLRAIGAQIEKTTNRDACRDLSGRRLRDVKREKDLRRLLSLQKQLRQEKMRRKREKIAKLKGYIEKVESGGPSNSDLTEVQPKRVVIEEACDQGIIRNSTIAIAGPSKPSQPLPVPNLDNIVGRSDVAKVTDIKLAANKQLWLGVDFYEDEDDDGDDPDHEVEKNNDKLVSSV